MNLVITSVGVLLIIVQLLELLRRALVEILLADREIREAEKLLKEIKAEERKTKP